MRTEPPPDGLEALAPPDAEGRAPGDAPTGDLRRQRHLRRLRHLRERTFAPSREDGRVGLEVEMIPVDQGTGRAADTEERVLPLLRRAAACAGWREEETPGGTPGFRLPHGCLLSFEPGGQLEISTPALVSVDEVLARLDETHGVLRSFAADHGVALLCRGMDPLTPDGVTPLISTASRYLRQAAHYDGIGPWGRRMMRQSAAIHVNVDLGRAPLQRWSVANRIAPYLTALFANSPRWEGRETGHRSWRAAQWRRLDPARTGLPYRAADPVEAYLDFALAAPAFLLGDAGAPAEPYGTRLAVDTPADADAFAAHLSTLFPEVRPRGYLEIRSFDSLPGPLWGVPPAVVAGVLYDPDASVEAEHTFPPPTPELLERAGRLGVTDDDVRAGALALLDLALAGAERLGPEHLSDDLRSGIADYRTRYTARGLDPGHDSRVVVGGREGREGREGRPPAPAAGAEGSAG